MYQTNGQDQVTHLLSQHIDEDDNLLRGLRQLGHGPNTFFELILLSVHQQLMPNPQPQQLLQQKRNNPHLICAYNRIFAK